MGGLGWMVDLAGASFFALGRRWGWGQRTGSGSVCTTGFALVDHNDPQVWASLKQLRTFSPFHFLSCSVPEVVVWSGREQ